MHGVDQMPRGTLASQELESARVSSIPGGEFGEQSLFEAGMVFFNLD